MRSGKLFRFDLRTVLQSAASIFCAGVLLFAISCKSSPQMQPSSAASQTSEAQSADTATAAPEQPNKIQPFNIVLITIDTLRADHLHCYGDQKVKTPNIDALASDGVLFEKAVTQAPLTAPSHASIFTGTNPNVHHVRDTGGFILRPSSVTFTTILKKNGWDTAGFIGSEVLKRSFGFNQGFSFYDDQMPRSTEKGYLRDASRPANIVVDHAVSWLNASSKQPFFMWLHFYDPHEPYRPPASFLRQYPGKPYDAAIAFTDQQIGRFLAAVRKKSPAEKTIIVLMADHGESLGEHGEFNHGIFLYDSTLRIPWIMTGPGIPKGLRVSQQVREIDLLPTILNLTGVQIPRTVQGTSLVPTFSGKQVPTRYSYEETLYPKLNLGWSELRGIHTAHWMYVRAPRPELYDLDRDPGEINNVIDAHPKEYRELEEQLKILSDAGVGEQETVVANQMDNETMKKLQSLGYVGGTAGSNVQMNGKGADPKDRLAILKLIHTVMGPDSAKLPIPRRIELLKQGLTQDPTNPALYFQLGQLYTQTAQYDAAVATYQTAIRSGVQDQTILTNLADIYLQAGRKDAAIHYFEQAAQLNPLNPQCQSNLGTAYLQSNREADAELAFRRALVSRQYPQAYNGLAIVAMRRHDTATARKDYERAIQLNPDYAEAQYNLGMLCRQTSDIPCARKAFHAFLNDVPVGSYQNLVPQAKAELAGMETSGKERP